MKRETKGLTPVARARRNSTDPVLQHQIAERAYQLFEMRGHSHGNDMDDWLRAEREVRAAGARPRTTARTKGATSRTKTRKAA